MSYTENALVIHRVGGLEDEKHADKQAFSVIHRVGGLEASIFSRKIPLKVIHRVGGLEVETRMNTRAI